MPRLGERLEASYHYNHNRSDCPAGCIINKDKIVIISQLSISRSLSLSLFEYCDKYGIKRDDKIFAEHLFFTSIVLVFLIVQHNKPRIQIISDNKAVSKCISNWGPGATIYWIIYRYFGAFLLFNRYNNINHDVLLIS